MALERTAPLRVARRRGRGNLVPFDLCSAFPAGAGAATRQEVSEPIGSGQSSPASDRKGRSWRGRSRPRWPLTRRQLDRSCIARCTAARIHCAGRRLPVRCAGWSVGLWLVLEDRRDCRSRQAAPDLPGARVTSPGYPGRPSLSRRAEGNGESRSPTPVEERRGVGSRPGGGKAAGKVAGLLRCASGAGGICRWKALRAGGGALLDGSAATSVLYRESGTRSVRGWASSAVRGRERRRSAAPLRCGAPPSRIVRERASRACLKPETVVKRLSTCIDGAARRSRSGNRAVAPVLVFWVGCRDR